MTDNDFIPRHPIRVVAQRTGLTPAALRAWERRYEAVRPGRSEGGQRLYSDRDVAHLRVLRQLTENGRPIGMIAAMSFEDAESLLLEDRAYSSTPAPDEHPPGTLVDEAIAKLRAFDASGLERHLWHAATTLGATAFLDDVVTPLLFRIGEDWVAGQVTPAQEHLGSEALERTLERLAEPSRSTHGPRLVVATLSGEHHGLGARLVSTVATLEGWCVTYLGTDLPVSEIAATAESVGAETVAISVVSRNNLTATVGSLAALRGILRPAVQVLVGGAGSRLIEADQAPDGVSLLDGIDEFRGYLGRGLSPQGAS
jgi:DNA-binding transcriptional MerR regulator/methylmalonyl-CoA mutase cobalamin-binding subunit